MDTGDIVGEDENRNVVWQFGESTSLYDGDGEFHSRLVITGVQPTDLIFGGIRSSVLGGQAVSYYRGGGEKLKTFVYSGGVTLACQFNAVTGPTANDREERVYFSHADLSGKSSMWTKSNGEKITEAGTGYDYENDVNFLPAELDGAGNIVGFSDPYWQPEPTPLEAPEYVGYMPFANPGERTTYNPQEPQVILDGIAMTLSEYEHLGRGLQNGVFRIISVGNYISDIPGLGTIERAPRFFEGDRVVWHLFGWDMDGPFEQRDELKRDFGQRLKLNDSKCKEMVNKLLNGLGKKFKSKDGSLTGIEARAEMFFSNRKYPILSSASPSSSGEASGSYENRVIKLLSDGGQFFFGANAKMPTTAGSTTIYNIGEFLHELIHAAGGRSGIGHKTIVSAIFELEGLKDFKQYVTDAENEATKLGLKGEKKTAFLDQKFARDFGYWQGN